MYGFKHAGAMLRAYRKQVKLTQTAFAAKTQLVDGQGISEFILSRIERGHRPLLFKYLSLIERAEIFPTEQMHRLRVQAVADLIRRQFGYTVIAITFSLVNEEDDETSAS